ncbi:MAG: MCP four helix bundle domain-containing protein [Opitutae bacterium]|nr:MCP four helix bundle domain-containing protein [Opitutae bacterium]
MLLHRLKFLLIVALLVSNLLAGILGIYYLQTLNRRYAALLESRVPLLDHLRTLTRELGAVQRLALRVTGPVRDPHWPELVRLLDETSNNAKTHATEIALMESVRETRSRSALLTESLDYDEKADAFLALVRRQDTGPARDFLASTLRPAYRRYMLVLDAVAARTQNEGNDLSADYTEDSEHFGNLLLLVTGWPLLLIGTLLFLGVILTAILVSTMRVPGLIGSHATDQE